MAKVKVVSLSDDGHLIESDKTLDDVDGVFVLRGGKLEAVRWTGPPVEEHERAHGHKLEGMRLPWRRMLRVIAATERDREVSGNGSSKHQPMRDEMAAIAERLAGWLRRCRSASPIDGGVEVGSIRLAAFQDHNDEGVVFLTISCEETLCAEVI